MSKAWCVTHFSDVVDFSCEWKIVNFSRLLKIHQKVKSPSLTIPGTGGLICRLVCSGYFPGGIVSKIQANQVEKVVEEASLFSIALELEDGGLEVKLAGFVDVLCDDVWLRGSFGDQTKEEFIARRNTVGDKYGWIFTSLPIKFYTSTANKFTDYNGFWFTHKPNQPLQIKLTLFSPGEMTQTSSMMPKTVTGGTSELVVDMKSLILETKHSDVVLKCKGEKFHCHKAILGARSAVFSRMFDVDMKEATSGLVVIDDVEPIVVEAMVEFIYTADVTKQVDDLSKLVYIGDKYELKGLVEFCLHKFECDRSDYQLVEMLILADKHSLDKFKDLAMKRIIMDKDKFISDEDFLLKIEKHPKLLIELFKS